MQRTGIAKNESINRPLKLSKYHPCRWCYMLIKWQNAKIPIILKYQVLFKILETLIYFHKIRNYMSQYHNINDINS